MRKKGTSDLAAVCLLLAAFLMIGAGIVCVRLRTVWNSYENAFHFSEELNLAFTNADEVVVSLRTCLKNRVEGIVVEFDADGEYMDVLPQVLDELMDAALTEPGCPTGGDYLRYQYGGYEYTYSRTLSGASYHYTVQIAPNYYADSQKEEKTDEKVDEILSELDLSDVECMEDEEKISRIYQYICTQVKYDYVHKNHENNHIKSTAYSALVLNTAGCQGYALAIYRLMSEVGIDCKIVTGTAVHDGVEEYHAWNLVKLGDVYYNLDATWDAGENTYSYKLVTDAEMPDHVRDDCFQTEEFRFAYPMAGE